MALIIHKIVSFAIQSRLDFYWNCFFLFLMRFILDYQLFKFSSTYSVRPTRSNSAPVGHALDNQRSVSCVIILASFLYDMSKISEGPTKHHTPYVSEMKAVSIIEHLEFYSYAPYTSSCRGSLTYVCLSLFTEPKQNKQAVTISDAFQARYKE